MTRPTSPSSCDIPLEPQGFISFEDSNCLNPVGKESNFILSLTASGCTSFSTGCQVVVEDHKFSTKSALYHLRLWTLMKSKSPLDYKGQRL